MKYNIGDRFHDNNGDIYTIINSIYYATTSGEFYVLENEEKTFTHRCGVTIIDSYYSKIEEDDHLNDTFMYISNGSDWVPLDSEIEPSGVWDDPWNTPPKILKDNHGNIITTERYNELYCSCGHEEYTIVNVLRVDHKICKSCKKEKKGE